MTAPNPLPWPSDAYFCPRCQIHRTTTPTRLCPCCKGDDERAEKEASCPS